MPDLVLIAAPFVGLAGCIVVHIAAANLLRGARTLSLMAGSFFVGAGICKAIVGCVVLAQPASWSDRFGALATALLTYGGFAYCYVNFVNVAIASLRVRIITELDGADDGVAIDELTAKYGVRDIVAVRLERLSGAGQIEERAGRYYCRPSTIYRLSLALSLLKRILFGRRWGRDWD